MRCDGGPPRVPDNSLGQQTPLLRSVLFAGICPLLASTFPLPSLTKPDLDLQRNVDPLRLSLLSRLCSDCPVLQNARVNVEC